MEVDPRLNVFGVGRRFRSAYFEKDGLFFAAIHSKQKGDLDTPLQISLYTLYANFKSKKISPTVEALPRLCAFGAPYRHRPP